MNVICTDNRFELIQKYKEKLIQGTNIETSKEEMNVIDNILFRFWQMGWLEALEKQTPKKCETREGKKAYRCPLCGEWFIGSVDDMIYRGAEPNFCSLCGQALDWGDFK